MRPRSLDDFLKHAHVPFTAFQHPPAFSAQQEAARSHVPGRSWAKTVICFAGDEPIAAVVPAHLMVDLERLRVLADAATLRLASEPQGHRARQLPERLEIDGIVCRHDRLKGPAVGDADDDFGRSPPRDVRHR